MYDVYDIVRIEYTRHNKGECFVSNSYIITLIPPKCTKTREPEDEQCVLWCNQE